MSDTIYTLLDISDEDSSGPIHERIATIFEVVRGHTSVLAEFRRRRELVVAGLNRQV